MKSLFRAYMSYWGTPEGREARRWHVGMMTPAFAAIVVVGIWARFWPFVIIGAVMTAFCVWRLKVLTKSL